MVKMLFKKGDKVRLIKYPHAKGVVSNVTENMIWCMIDDTTKVPFADPKYVEFDVDETKTEKP